MNELNKLTTQSDALAAIRLQRYVIGSVNQNGDFSIAVSPMPHSLASDARLECKRLAKLNPGKAFIIMSLEGAELVPTTAISI